MFALDLMGPNEHNEAKF
jgi:hypothetical protein